MLRLLANIRFHTQDENGPQHDAKSGIRPNFGFDDVLITSEFLTVDQNDPVFIRGRWSRAEVRLPYGDAFDDKIRPGLEFRINFGGSQVGRGVVEQILEIYHDPRNQEIRDEVRSKR